MDSWYATAKTLRLIDSFGWKYVAWIKSNRQVNFTAGKYHAVSDIRLTNYGVIVWLRNVGKVKLIKTIRCANDIDYLVTNDITLSYSDILQVAARRWSIEEYHRGIKQTAGASLCQARTNRSQRNHIFSSIRLFIALEKQRFRIGHSWYEQKRMIVAEAISQYLKSPTIPLPVLG